MAREAGNEMFDRLQWMTLQPSVILDCGCGVGEMSTKLKTRYPNACVIASDLSLPMLCHGRSASSSPFFVCADSRRLPLPNQSVDMVFANFLWPWQVDVTALLQEWRRLLKAEGVLMFTALGPDTLKEWQQHLQADAIPQWYDMHDIGDLLMRERFCDPVLDVNHYVTTFESHDQLSHELKASGMWFPSESTAILPKEANLTVSYEVIFAHAFAPSASQTISEDGVVKVPLTQLKKQLRG